MTKHRIDVQNQRFKEKSNFKILVLSRHTVNTFFDVANFFKIKVKNNN